jgi:hypothetical protein
MQPRYKMKPQINIREQKELTCKISKKIDNFSNLNKRRLLFFCLWFEK